MYTNRWVKLFNSIRNADIFKVFSFTAFSTFVRMLTSFISVKVLAVIVGPGGVALLGQLSNFSSIIQTIGSGGINSGVTKYVAEFKEDSDKVSTILSTSTKISLILSITIGLLLIVFSLFLSNTILKSPDYSLVFKIFGFTLIFYTLNNQLVSILIGFKEFRKYVFINIFASVFGLLFTVVLVLLWNLKGALIASVSYQSVTFFISMIIVIKRPWFNRSLILNKFNKSVSKKLFGYSLMTLVTASTNPVSQMLVRDILTNTLSLSHAGIWDGMNRLSGMLLGIFTTSLSVYYLPKLSETKNNVSIRLEVIRVYKFITPILVSSIILIYVFRKQIISLIFTSDFNLMSDLFLYQLIGDLFKMMAWILSFIMLAKAMTKKYIITEIIFASCFVAFSFLFLTKLGFVGVSIAYMFNNFLYFLIMIFIFRQLLLKKVNG